MTRSPRPSWLVAPKIPEQGAQRRRPSLYWGLYFVISCGLLFVLASGISPALQTAKDAGCRALSPQAPANPGALVPDLVFEDLQGNKVRVREEGKFRVINFWATWCEPCIDEWPDLDRLADRVAEQPNIEVWAVSIDEDEQALRAFLRDQGLEHTKVRVLLDRTHKAHESFGSQKIPDTYFVNARSQIEQVFVNVRAWGKPEAQRCVEAAAGS